MNAAIVLTNIVLVLKYKSRETESTLSQCYTYVLLLRIHTSDVNDAEIFDSEQRLLVIDAETRLTFSENK